MTWLLLFYFNRITWKSDRLLSEELVCTLASIQQIFFQHGVNTIRGQGSTSHHVNLTGTVFYLLHDREGYVMAFLVGKDTLADEFLLPSLRVFDFGSQTSCFTFVIEINAINGSGLSVKGNIS